MKATPKTLQRIHAALYKQGLLYQKANMVAGYTNGRTESSKEMSQEEAAAMLADLNKSQSKEQDKDKMVRKIIAMAREMGYVVRLQVVAEDGKLVVKSDYMKLNRWMTGNSYLKKPLSKYSYQELPKLVSQFQAVYSDWLRKYH